jgi:O-phosphoseryl-tRNA(Cys) synthetase
LSARRFFEELFDEIADLRLHFKTVRTLRGLLTPGWLTAEYLAGRRQAYLAPFSGPSTACRRPPW